MSAAADAGGSLGNPVWQSRQLWSWWDMVTQISQFLQTLGLIRGQLQTFSILAPDLPLAPGPKNSLATSFGVWQELSYNADFARSLAVTENVIGKRTGARNEHPIITGVITARRAVERIGQYEEALAVDVEGRYAKIIGATAASHYGVSFDYRLDIAFPSARSEIVEANTCFAMERHTACVFHLMRAMEHGYRALAIKLGVKKPKTALEYDTWGQLLAQIEQKTEAIIDSLQGPKRPLTTAREFFNPALADMRYFMDAVRNIVMHTRTGGTYDAQQAISIRKRVLDSFVHLAKYVREDGPRITKSTFRLKT